MGAGISRRLAGAGHRIVGFDTEPGAHSAQAASGCEVAESIPDLIGRLGTDPLVWLMVPSGTAVDATIEALLDCEPRPRTIIDGGNSNYRKSIERQRTLASVGVEFVDVGTSGGIRGEEAGYCLMIGGRAQAVDSLAPLFQALAPAHNRGWGHVGPPGAGHFVKMIHNGIEYGVMQALAEGFAILDRRDDFRLDLPAIATIWNDGSVIRSWLLELAGQALARDPRLAEVRSGVDDSGEGRWAVAEAIDCNVAAPVITHALITRIQSRDPESFSNRLLSALRREFGGHAAGVTKG